MSPCDWDAHFLRSSRIDPQYLPICFAMPETFSDAELEAYLDEALDPQRVIELEETLSKDKDLLGRLSQINGRRNAGVHTLAEIWRRNQIGVPSKEEMSRYLLQTLSDEHADYIAFRIETLRCPFTVALYKDLKQQAEESEDQKVSRRRKFYESSAGLLRNKDRNEE